MLSSFASNHAYRIVLIEVSQIGTSVMEKKIIMDFIFLMLEFVLALFSLVVAVLITINFPPTNIAAYFQQSIMWILTISICTQFFINWSKRKEDY